ncbi:MAG: Rha family transcriptional regulator [Methylacidiphilales bacterium]|nr:Rha family transcriptional regulator [Candidatus Methylacidiphilales bacterium]
MTISATLVHCHLRTSRSLSTPVVFVKDGHVFASSEDVAAYFGKQHSVVLRAIKSLVSNDKSCACNFAFTQRDVPMPTGGVRKVATYHMTRDGFTLLAMGFTGKRALGWKLKYIEAFNAMEADLRRNREDERMAREAERAPNKGPMNAVMVDDEPAPPRKARKPRLAVDDMDRALDLLVTAETALRAKGWLDRETIEAIAGTIGQGLRHLRPVRVAIDAA